MGIFDKFQEKVKNCYQILAKNCQIIAEYLHLTANLGGSNFLFKCLRGPDSQIVRFDLSAKSS